MKNIAIVLAGGSGSRMQSSTPKQFLLIKGLPVLMHTLQAFFLASSHPEIILVIARSEQQTWQQLCLTHHFSVPHQVVTGGRDRFSSVYNALQAINDQHSLNQDIVVGVHDGVRPLVSPALIELIFTAARSCGSAVPCLECRESIRLIQEKDSVMVRRSDFRMVQTPQCFPFIDLYEAYTLAAGDGTEYTDDASVAEKRGMRIHLVDGENRNIKITYPEDLLIAAALL